MMKALIAMSGGVDSGVAAFLMKEQGYDCIGATMKLFRTEDLGERARDRSCCSLEDAEDAREVAYAMGMPHYVFNFADRFRENVIDRFAEAYRNGRTPNPCIDCNRYLKFGELFRRAKELECDCIATGHYARIGRDGQTGRYLLKKAVDPEKDQSYVLYALTQEQLAHTRFPLGEMTKAETRAIAEANGFVNAKKRESQDICFVQNESYADFLTRYTGAACPEGDFLDTEGRVLGRHRGIIHYTVGQRKGLGLSFSQPMYVREVDPVMNTVTLSTDAELYARTLIARDVNLIPVPSVEGAMRVKARIRYRHREQWATVTQEEDGALRVVFDEPQRAITRGQAVVLYDGETVVGGGTIDQVLY